MRAFGSLRVRLPLVFLAGIMLAGLVTTLIAVRLFRDFAHDQALSKLQPRGERHRAAVRGGGQPRATRQNTKKSTTSAHRRGCRRRSLELATGDKIYLHRRATALPGHRPIRGCERLPPKTIDWISGKSLSFEFMPPGTRRVYYAVANPIVTGSATARPVGAIVVATTKTDVSQRVYDLIERLTLAGILGLARRRAPRVVPLAPDRPARAAAVGRGGRGRRGELRRGRCRSARRASSAT